MKSRRLKRVALFAGLAGFVWFLLAIDPVVNSGRSANDFNTPDGNPSAEIDQGSTKNLVAER